MISARQLTASFSKRSRWLRCLAALPLALFLSAPPESRAADSAKLAPSAWGNWVEADYPFFSSILDARKAGAGFPTNNLTPRGLVLNLGGDCWACFDVDLLRVSAIWQGKGVTPRALAPGSYHEGKKTPGGQFPAPEPEGTVWFANGIYPGWQAGPKLLLVDPRESAPTPTEVGRGPLPESFGRFEAVRHVREGVILEYRIADAAVREWWKRSEANGKPVIERHVTIDPSRETLNLVLGRKASDAAVSFGALNNDPGGKLAESDGLWTVRVSPHQAPVTFCVSFAMGNVPSISSQRLPDSPAPSRWPQEIISKGTLSTEKKPYVVDHIALPVPNPWKRNVRPSDIQFLKDGTAYLVTLDGDVWRLRGLNESLAEVRWKRFATGLHEPMSLVIRDEQVYVFDRNGIWRLRDTNDDGEADRHELFSNAFAQTADMREFPSTIRLAPQGEFIIAKGGQQATTLGKHNGSVLRVSADGRYATVLGYGFRQPNIGVNVRTGLITSSDQQGQYIPSTPLHIVRDAQFYGYLAEGLQEKEKYPSPIADPLTWIPHAVNASAISQVWLFGAKMGPLNDSMVHIGFNRPEVFQVLFNQRGLRPQASVVSITSAFAYPPLNGSVNPADGQLYIGGFQVVGWGNSLDTLQGFERVRYTGAPVTLPREVAPMDQGILLRFDHPLDAKQACNPESYSIASWHYKRTYQYGSPQYKADGTPGMDWLTASSAYLSKDGRSVFVGIPDLKPVMQLRIGWSLATKSGTSFEDNAYTTPYELPKFNPAAEGFENITVDLTPRAAVAKTEGPVNIEEGRRLSQLFGCAACHSTDGIDVAKVGPSWKGLFGSQRAVVVNKKKTTAQANEAYLRESILDPPAKIISGYEKGEYAMPSYAGVVTDSQVESLILFIKALK